MQTDKSLVIFSLSFTFIHMNHVNRSSLSKSERKCRRVFDQWTSGTAPTTPGQGPGEAAACCALKDACKPSDDCASQCMVHNGHPKAKVFKLGLPQIIFASRPNRCPDSNAKGGGRQGHFSLGPVILELIYGEETQNRPLSFLVLAKRRGFKQQQKQKPACINSLIWFQLLQNKIG